MWTDVAFDELHGAAGEWFATGPSVTGDIVVADGWRLGRMAGQVMDFVVGISTSFNCPFENVGRVKSSDAKHGVERTIMNGGWGWVKNLGRWWVR